MTNFAIILVIVFLFGFAARLYYTSTVPDLYKDSEGCVYIQDPDSFFFLYGDGLNSWFVQHWMSLGWKSENCAGLAWSLLWFVIALFSLGYVIWKLGGDVLLGLVFFVLNHKVFFWTSSGFFDYELIFLVFGVWLVYFVCTKNVLGTMLLFDFGFFFWDGWVIYAAPVLLWWLWKAKVRVRYKILIAGIITTIACFAIKKKFYILYFSNITEFMHYGFLNLSSISALWVIPLICLFTAIYNIENKYYYFQYVYGVTASIIMAKTATASLIPMFLIISKSPKHVKTILIIALLLQTLLIGYTWQPIQQTFQNNDHLTNYTQTLNNDTRLLTEWEYGHYFRSKNKNAQWYAEPTLEIKTHPNYTSTLKITLQ